MSAPTEQVPGHRSEIVVACGAATTLVALAVVYYAAHHGFNIMGWYYYYVLPVGALAVGALAASGYGIAAWFTGLKMSKRFMWSVVGQLAASYLIAQYEEYQQMVPNGEIGFWAWYDLVARSFNFGHDPLGSAGYFFRLLEVAGFVAGGLLVPVALAKKPYCDPCRTYRRSKVIGWLPWLGPTAGFDDVRVLFDTAATGEPTAFTTELQQRTHAHDRVRRDRTKIALVLSRCPRCAGGHIVANTHERHGRNVRITKMGEVPLAGERTRALFDAAA
jgi:hypothetical protein